MRSLTVILGSLTVAATCAAQTPKWTQIKPTTSPSARAAHGMVYDSARQRTVLFGGVLPGNVTYLGDTWEWDGRNWTRIRPTNSPIARHSFAMAYDSVRQRTVLFGGSSSPSSTLGDTWEWDGNNWTRITPTNSPSARYDSGMAYDSVRQRTVLFGGRFPADTWEWDGVNWTKRNPTTSPPTRRAHAMAYDSTRRRIVLFGGWTGRKFLGDTWEWDGTNWAQIRPVNSPSARQKSAMVYDSARQRTVLFGGWDNNTLADTWEWNGTNWAQTTPIPSAGRNYTGMAFDSVRQRTVLFGGFLSQTVFSADTWEYGIPNLTLTASPPTISIANGGTQTLTLNAGTGLGNKSYWVFGSATSTMPGIVLTGIHIPLVPDIYTTIALGAVNTTVFTKFMGPLSATGTATASLIVPKMLSIPTGFKLYHAYVVYDGTTGQIFTSSNPVSVEFK